MNPAVTERAALTVAFVCAGNVCRSPFAERYGSSLVGAHGLVRFISAGIRAHAGAPMDPLMADEVRRRGGDPDGVRARGVDGAQLACAHLVLTMESAHRSLLIRDFPACRANTFTVGQMLHVLDDLPTGTALRSALTAHPPRPRPEEDVPDPYRRGNAAMAASADLIATALDRLVPAEELRSLADSFAAREIGSGEAGRRAALLLGRGR